MSSRQRRGNRGQRRREPTCSNMNRIVRQLRWCLGDVKAQNKNLQENLEDFEDKNTLLETENQNLRTENQNLQSENQNLQSENQNLQSENQNLQSENQDLQTKKQDLETEIEELSQCCK